MRWIIVGAVVALAGCVGQPVAEPEPRVVRIEVPVQVPCPVTVPAVPAWAGEGLRRSDGLEVKVRALLAERRQRIGYERELVATVVTCQ
ncbi:lipoprotein [Pseudomonas oryzihabitans]|nr:lipoprotein [Pseudomonas psychrotolerans]